MNIFSEGRSKLLTLNLKAKLCAKIDYIKKGKIINA
jgi:hypothetical protein